jgi:hypothetical protein
VNPGITSERVYDALKRHIASGDILPGDRLEPALFAERFNSSVTPVRDALHRLAGERLVEMRTSEGFHVPLISEPGLRDLYRWNADLIRIVVRDWPSQKPAVSADDLPVDIGRATRAFFDLFAAGTSNREHASQIALANDRLATARAAERQVLADLEIELRAMAVAFDSATTAALLKLVVAYHRRRLQATPAIVRALYG